VVSVRGRRGNVRREKRKEIIGIKEREKR